LSARWHIKNLLSTTILCAVCGLIGALLFVGTLVAFWQIIVPLASPSAQDWRRFVTEIAGGLFPIFWTFVLYLIASMSASVFLPKKSLDGRLLTVSVLVYLVYAEASFWALSAVRDINREAAGVMASCLINPYFYPIGILTSVPPSLAIFFVRRIEPWNVEEAKRLLVILPVALIILGSPFYARGLSAADTFANIWNALGNSK
jgi:hypothetical protein